ncbi:TolB family protein [Paenibacillus alginolyticus]|uniref:Translocation protein TolB n=1 Tax=Paenibacillus alginolyticus TaxID=59839 RepID=A0ABT4GNU6_9BACL|nr:translocation protein TolB [Paenibacillus alginolyticus]MCY9697888.1 translocation protein TolB [Paenibacillus alginolyticus]MEC0145718.1 translocation protein TolB [Paenibacillus alginolyticus]
MRAFRNTILAMLAVLLIITSSTTIYAEKPSEPLKAAFVRSGDLWMKAGNNERQLTRGVYILNPKWSYDGQWIAYSKGENEQELWLLQVQTGQSHLVAQEGGRSFQWQPNRNSLAFLTSSQLNWIDSDEFAKPKKIAEGIGNFSWYPDGSGILVSMEAKLLNEGWTPIRIVKIPLTAIADPNRFETLYVLPKQSDDFFAVATSIFKWSANGRWIAFLAKPTASLSADGNTLCVLSADGSVFKTIDQMVNNEQWFEWASKDETLGFIEGIGREATTNKHLKVMRFPAGKSVSYTPKGYVEHSLTWRGLRDIVTSRSKEAEWSIDPAKRQFPYLVNVKLKSHQEKQLTQPSDTYGDFNPISLPSHQLAWIRSNRSYSNVVVTGPLSKKAETWIENIDLGANYYEQRNWNTVLSFYIRK